MASITLTDVRMGLVSDLAAQIVMPVASIDATTSIAGEVRLYANGRFRSIARAGTRRTVPLTFKVTDRSVLTSLYAWQGQLVIYRDPRGRKVFGVFHDVTVGEQIGAVLADVSLTLVEVTHSEAV